MHSRFWFPYPTFNWVFLPGVIFILGWTLGWTLTECCATEPTNNNDPNANLVRKFELDIQPILTARGCNAGPCHGKARGQNGFALSLLGFDANMDFEAIVKNSRGRRLSIASPTESLLLTKATGKLPHGGEFDSPKRMRIIDCYCNGLNSELPGPPMPILNCLASTYHLSRIRWSQANPSCLS